MLNKQFKKITHKLPTLKNLSWYDWLLIALLLISFLVRLDNYSFPFDIGGGDTARDYLVSKSIIGGDDFALKAYPLFGPGNDWGLINSPIYYYLGSFFLLFNNSFFFLNLVNIFFQTLTILFIYLFVRFAFGQAPAFFASLLFSFDLLVMRQALHMWQPWFMQPFFYLSLLLLYLSWKNSSPKFLYSSIGVFVLAGALHNAAFAMLPTFLVLVAYILWKRWNNKRVYWKAFITLVSTSLVLYLPSLVLLYKQYTNSILSLGAFMDRILVVGGGWNNPFEDLGNFYRVLQWPTLDLVPYWGVVLSLVLVPLFYFSRNRFRNFGILLIIGWLVLQPSLFLNMFLGADRYNTHYVAFTSGLVYIFVSVLLYHYLGLFKKLGKVIWGTLLVVVSLYFAPAQQALFSEQFAYASTNQEDFEGAVDAIQGELEDLKQKNGFDNYTFFSLMGFVNNNDSGIGRLEEALVWLGLEDRLGEQFVRVGREGTYFSDNKTQYVFLICLPDVNHGPWERFDCRDAYAKREKKRYDEKSFYRFPKEIYSRGVVTVFVNEEAFPQED